LARSTNETVPIHVIKCCCFDFCLRYLAHAFNQKVRW